MSQATQPLEDMIDGAVAVGPEPRVVEIPERPGRHQAGSEKNGKPAHLPYNQQGQHHACQMNPGIARRTIPGIVAGDAALPHDNDGKADKGEHEQLKRAGQFCDAGRIEQDKQGDDNTHGNQQRKHRYATGRQAIEPGGQETIPAHGHWITGSAHDPGVGDGYEGEYGRDRQQYASPPPEEETGRSRCRGQIAHKAFDGDDADHNRCTQAVDQ